MCDGMCALGEQDEATHITITTEPGVYDRVGEVSDRTPRKVYAEEGQCAIGALTEDAEYAFCGICKNRAFLDISYNPDLSVNSQVTVATEEEAYYGSVDIFDILQPSSGNPEDDIKNRLNSGE